MQKPAHTMMTKEEGKAALEQMLQSPGWRIYKEFMQSQIAYLTDKYVCESIDPNVLLRTGGAIKQTRVLMAWPETQLTAWKQPEKRQQQQQKSEQED